MREIFYQVLYLSEVTSYLILGVIVARLVLWKAPKRLVCLLWILVAVRLAIPFSVESVYSLIPAGAENIRGMIEEENRAEAAGWASPEPDTIMHTLQEEVSEGKAVTRIVINREMAVNIAMWIWLGGMAFMSVYFVHSYFSLKSKVGTAVPVVICGEKVYRSDNIESPFLLGVFRPRIYVPVGMEEEILTYAIAHEKAHLERRDNLIRLAGCLFLMVYWFHPLVWISYVLSGRDMEYACDESVIDGRGADFKREYAMALLSCLSTGKKVIRHTAAFGEVGGKKRIIKILNYKRPAFWGVAGVMTAVLLLVICFMSSHKKEENVIYYDGAEITFVKGVFCPELGGVSLVFNVDRNGSDAVNKVVLGGKSTTGMTVSPLFVAGDINQEGMNEVTFFGIVVFPITNFSDMVEAYERISQLGYHEAQPNSFVYWDDNGVLKITFSEVVSVENIQSFEVVSLQL